MDIHALKNDLRKFAKERDWDKFHTPKNLIMALTCEIGELTELFQWLTDEESRNLNNKVKNEASQELADIFIYLIRLFDILEIDPSNAVKEKLDINRKKYPVDLSYGNATKYNKRND